MIAKLSIYRFDPDSNEDSRFDMFQMDLDAGETVLSALMKIYENFDSSLSFRFACGKVKCGECSMMVNHSPCLACDKKIEPEMIIEPLPNLPIIKDLVIDRNRVFHRVFESVLPLIEPKETASGAGALDSETNDAYVKMTTCFECMICQSMCPVLKKRPDQFTGPLGLLWLARETLTNSDHYEEMREMVKMCSFCGECWKKCPSEINFLEGAITFLLEKLEIHHKKKS